jgi:hypothetical protein
MPMRTAWLKSKSSFGPPLVPKEREFHRN